MDRYKKTIVKTYNDWAVKYNEAVKTWSGNESYYAFMMNAVNAAVLRSNNSELREYFDANARV